MDSATANTSFLAAPLTFAARNAMAPGEDAGIDAHLSRPRPAGPTFESVSPKGAFAAAKTLKATKLPNFMGELGVVRNRFRSKEQMPVSEYLENYQRCYARFEKVRVQVNLQCGMYAVDMMPMVGITATEKARRFPCWFLPWNQEGGLTHMTIPRTTYLHTRASTSRPASAAARDTDWGDFADNPPYFFTTALSGCSVFITGSADSPTIYHAGKGSSVTDHSSGHAVRMDARQLWHDCFRDVDPVAFASKAFSEVNKGHYSGDTQRVSDYKALLVGYDIQVASSVGTVFGIRQGHLWEFYLQEIARITYKRASDNQIRTVHRPIALVKIFPGAVGSVTLHDHTQVRHLKN